MSFGTQKTIVLTKDELKDLESYCALNKFNVDEIIKSSFKQGFSIEKYGLLENMGGIQEKRVEIEVIREKRVEIPVEVIKEVVKIEYVEVPVEKIVEVIKEVIVEKEVIKEIIKEVPVEKIVTIYDNSSENELLLKIQQLENGIAKKDSELDELRQKFSTKEDEITTKEREFSTITTENENIFQYKISKKDEELDELRHSLDKLSVVVKNETTESLLKPKIEALQKTLQELRKQIREKDKFILQLRKDVLLLQEQPNKRAIFLASTNLNNEIK
jgi:chromosome segregation ATPase